jgi:nucleoside-diphosphate-sugar epimerase
MKEKFIVIGAFGQIGSELVPTLQKYFGKENVVALGHSFIPQDFDGIAEKGSVLEPKKIATIIDKYKITTLINFASFLSVKSENDPEGAFQTNLLGLKNTLDIAKEKNLKVFWPSSIAVFGPTTPKENTPQDTIIEPTTMYGLTKRAGELLCQYYFLKWGVDVRSLRYPGLLDYKTPPSAGTTEYAKYIFYEGIKNNFYQCPLKEDTMLPMMYMEDAVEATIKIITTEKEKIKIRTSYNLASFSFSPKMIADELKKYLPNFKIAYKIDPQIQKIADSWPKSIDDSRARKDWGWKPKFSFEETVEIMFKNIKQKIR